MVVPKNVSVGVSASDVMAGGTATDGGRGNPGVAIPINAVRCRGTGTANSPTGGQRSIAWSPALLLQVGKFMVIRAAGVLGGQRCRNVQRHKA